MDDMGIDRTGVVAYYCVHYGKEYLEASIKSISSCVDKIYMFYSATPTQGHASGEPCPETEKELSEIAYSASGKVIWINVTGMFRSESDHRKFINRFTSGYKQILAVDCDEVHDAERLREALSEAEKLPNKYIQISGFINFFRSFNWVCYDGFQPVRITNLNYTEEREQGVVRTPVYHFSTAQREEIMRYKYFNFGHSNELRKDYLDEVFYKWSPENNIPNLHCVANGIWNAVPFDKTTMPEVLKDHPYYNLELIP